MLRLEAFPLPMLNAFMPKEFLCNGTISGRVDFNGDDIEHLDGVGFVCADSASLYYSEADATIHLSSDTLWLQDNVMQLDDYALHATGENPLRVNGVIDLRKGLPKARADLRMQGNNVWVIRNDKRARTNQMLAGSLPLDVDLRLSGPFTDLGLTGSVSALNATDLNFYMKASPLSAGAKTDQLVEFVSFDKMNRRNIAQIFAPRPIVKEGFHADIRLVIDGATHLFGSSEIQLRIGDLSIPYDTATIGYIKRLGHRKHWQLESKNTSRCFIRTIEFHIARCRKLQLQRSTASDTDSIGLVGR